MEIENIYPVIVQGIGVCAAICSVTSQIFKKVRTYYIAQLVANVLWMTHFIMLGQPPGAVINGLCMLRFVFLITGKHWAKGRKMMIAFLIMSVVVGAVTYSGIVSLIPAAMLFVSTVIVWSGNNVLIHIFQIALFSPCWLVYDYLAGSYSGVLTEVFNIIMVIIFFISMHKAKKAKVQQTIHI